MRSERRFMKNQTPRTRDLLLGLILAVLLYIKGRLFYPPLMLAGYEPAFALATAALFLLVYALLLCVSRRAARIVCGTVYAVISVFIAVDSVYLAYTSKLPSVTQLRMAWQIGDVSATVMDLLRVKHVLMVLDLPVWLNLLIHRKGLCGRIEKSRAGRSAAAFLDRELPRAASAALLGLAVLMGGAVFLYPDFRFEYLENEIFTYHAADMIEAVRPGIGARPVDKSRYASPDWSDSRYYGLAEGRNVIIIQVEALQNFVVGASYEGQELTPTLNRLIRQDTLYFDHYYYQIGGANTADAEFAVNNSLFAPEENGAYVRYPFNRYYPLATLLKDHGYRTAQAFHGYIGSFWNRETAYPYQGFDDFISLEDYEQTDMFPMGLSDMEYFRQTAEILEKLPEPFYALCVTVSSHYPYGIPLKDRDIELLPQDEQTLFGLYLQASNYADRAIGAFLDELEDKGLYDNSIILIYGDHYALPNTTAAIARRVGAITDGDYTIFDVFNVPFLIHIPGSGLTETISTAGGHMDVMPTLLCLLGITNDRAVMFGQNLLEAEHGFVCEEAHVSIGSFISDEVFFQMPHNNIRSNYRVYDRQTLAQLDPDDYADQSEEARRRILDCQALLARNDVFLDP